MKDHVSDKSGAELYKLNAELPLPDFVKQASVVSSEDLPGMAASNFADIYHKKFPICTKADTWLSSAFFQHHAADDILTEARLKEACELWDIDWSSTAPKIEKVAAEEPQGQIIYKNDAGVQHYVAPFFKMDHLNKIAEDLLQNPRKFTYEIRKNVARQLLKYANDARFTHGFVSDLQKTAAYGVGTLSAFEDALNVRRAALPEKNFDQVRAELADFNKMAQDASVDGYLKPEFLEKSAAVLDAIDNSCDFGRYYGTSMKAPEQEIFGISMHEFDVYNSDLIKLANGRYFHSSRMDFKDMADFLHTAFGKEAGSEQEDIKATMVELSGPNADLVSRYLDSKDAIQVEDDSEIKDGKKDGGESGIDWPGNNDGSYDRLPENEDAVARK
jgi:hypothetical protein